MSLEAFTGLTFVSELDDAELVMDRKRGLIIDVHAAGVHLRWFGTDAKPRLLATLARLFAELEAMP